MDIASHALARPLKQGATQLTVELNRIGLVGGGQHDEHRLQVGTAGRRHAPPALLQPVNDQIASHAPQPAAK